ncbi:uncharacterized protein EI90DRAFT_3052174 [Cantharellus anzutake]|uniref:uncharacterized protein n=1 Tax=Cantharellus anzutake TaxID=1750568 RepID=UPI001904E517|nr:uncharacterized protein EI90DRAFT_3052174 [Cantharellus anzutake]KAF8333487.1 hypothetical protein EI90DRAFT_3052174 [Cantharellus anzutake]
MQLWSAFAPITLLPVVMAGFLVGEITCDRTQQPFGAIVPSSADTCPKVLDYHNYTGENMSYGTLMSVQGLCGVDVGVNTVSNFWTASNGAIGHCDPVESSNETCIKGDREKCTWSILNNCDTIHVCPPGWGQ